MTNNGKSTEISSDTAWIANLSSGLSRDAVRRLQQTLLEMMKEIDGIFRENGIHYFIAWGTVLGAVRHGGFIPWDDDLDICVPDEDYERAIELLRNRIPATRVVHDKLTEDIYWCDFSKVRDVMSEVVAAEWPKDNKLKYRGICIDIFRAKKTTKTKFLKDHALVKARAHLGICKLKNKPLWKRLARLGLACGYGMANIFLASLESLGNILGRNKEYRIIGPFYRYKHMFESNVIFPVKDIQFEGVLLQAPAAPHKMLHTLYGDYMVMPPVEKRKTHFSSVTFFDKN